MDLKEGIPGNGSGGGAGIGPFLVPIAFLGLAGIFLIDPWPYSSPAAPRRETPAWAVDPSPVRKPVLRPEIAHAGYTYRCSECHAIMMSPPETDRPLTQHRHIRLEHGINNRCFNCHLRNDRDAYADYKGGPIPYDQPQLLCAKCHGPVYRDWTHNVHGRTNGFWSAKFGPVERKRCVECHDPHAPAFKPMAPAPAPVTLRRGDQMRRAGSGEQARNPLLIYRKSEPAAGEPGEKKASEEIR